MEGHFQSVNKLLSKNKKLSTYTEHFSHRSYWPDLPVGESPTPQQLQGVTKFEVLYQGNP
eukprot:7186753-Ditylum_brightwellii.AAC.1